MSKILSYNSHPLADIIRQYIDEYEMESDTYIMRGRSIIKLKRFKIEEEYTFSYFMLSSKIKYLRFIEFKKRPLLLYSHDDKIR